MSLVKLALTSTLVGLIKTYQFAVSPFSPACCKYYPTCSSYAIEAIQMHGPWRGLLMATWRLLRCNPWSEGGADPVPNPKCKKVEVENVTG
ncbi:MAG: membrane protein insertion efficiency factor YidD [Pseudomonadota bacterium]|nr:membrane protein insertion efficiency factor YidD [Pseudomonadota bacterium]